MRAKRVTFDGRVQGVGFRHTALEAAKGFEVSGWVKNLPDGTVELVACGDDEEMGEFIREIVEESPMARHIRHHTIEPVTLEEAPRGFRIVK